MFFAGSVLGGECEDSVGPETFIGFMDSYGSEFVDQTSNGDFVVIGPQRKTPSSIGQNGVRFSKFNSSGSLLLTKSMSGSNSYNYRSGYFAATKVNDGGYIVTNVYKDPAPSGKYHLTLFKFDSNGNDVWAKKMNPMSTWGEFPASITGTNDGGFIVAGEGHGSTNYNLLLSKFNSNGGLQWAKGVDSFSRERLSSIKQASDGGYIAGGYAYDSSSTNGYDFLFMKFDSSGNEVWSKIIGDAGTDYGYSVLEVSGGYLLAGRGSTDMVLTKVDFNGNKIWTKIQNSSSNAKIVYMTEAGDGGFLISGIEDQDVFLGKIDSNGNGVWAKKIDFSGYDVGEMVIKTSDGIILVGRRESLRMFILKTDDDGNIEGLSSWIDELFDFEDSLISETVIAANSYGVSPSFSGVAESFALNTPSSGFLWQHPNVPYISCWENLSGEIIDRADSGDVVRMVFAGGSSGIFNILEDDFGVSADDNIRSIGSGVIEGNSFVGNWSVIGNDLEQSEDGDYEDFFFEISGNKSGYLNVSYSLTPDLYWTNMDGNRISESAVGKSVRMVRTRWDNSVSKFFDIEEDDRPAFGWGYIKHIEGDDNDDVLEGIWQITQKDLDDADALTDSYDDFRFTNDDGEASDGLVVSSDSSDEDMHVEFLFPACGSYFNESESIEIKINASDPDDLIEGDFFINGGRVGSFVNGVTSFDEVLPVGDVQMIAEGSNSRGYRFKVYSNVMVLRMSDGINYDDGDYVAACILKPENFQDIDGVVVDFDASNTKGIRVTGGNAVDFSPDGNAGENIFSWVWRFFKPDGSEFASSPYEALNSVDSSSYIFSRVFPAAGDNSASLTVELGS